MSYNRNNNRDGGRGGSRGWGEPRPTGLASSLPAASSGKSSDARPAGEGEDAMWSRTARSTPAKPDDNTWRSSRPAEPSSSEGPRGWGGPRRRDEPVIDDVDDKFARSFGKMSTSAPAPAPAPRSFDEPPRRSNPYDEPPRRTGGGFGRGGDRNLDAEINAVDDKFSRAFGGSKANEESGDRGDRRGGFGDARREGGFGDSRREGGFGGPRREGGFGGEGRREGGFGGEGRREGGFGGEGRREGGFGGEGRREGGFSDARRRRDEDDGEWQNDPRFSSKFSSGGGGGRGRGGRDRDDRDGYRERRPPREVDPSRFEGPLPSAPKKSLAAAVNPVRAEEEAKAIEAAKQAKEEEAKRAREEKEAAKAARKKAEEDAKRAKEEAKRAEEEAKNAVLAAYTNAFNTTAEAIKSGLKGSALTAHLKTALVAPILPAGVLKAILASLNDDYTSVKWYGAEHFGDALKNLFPQDVPAQISLLYAVQDFCFSKKFPKITTKTGEKRLIEVLCNLLLAAEVVDMDGFIAWADDDNKLNIPGRTDAIVQTTNMVATVRAAMVEEEEEEEEDLDDYQQQYVR